MNSGQVSSARESAILLCESRKAMVLRHDSIARRLVTELGYSRPGQWNGFIPPSHFNGSPNGSPRRAALLEIEADAWQADQDDTDEETP